MRNLSEIVNYSLQESVFFNCRLEMISCILQLVRLHFIYNNSVTSNRINSKFGRSTLNHLVALHIIKRKYNLPTFESWLHFLDSMAELGEVVNKLGTYQTLVISVTHCTFTRS